MLNIYRQFLPHAAATQAPLHDVVSGPRVKDSHLITWTPEILKVFEDCKVKLSCATLLAHPEPSVPLALVTDASTSAMDAVLQQHVKNAWQPLAFFSKNIQPCPTDVQRLRSRATGHLRGRKPFPSYVGRTPLHHLHRVFTLSSTPSLASSLSLRHHHTTHWPHCRTATTSSEHSLLCSATALRLEKLPILGTTVFIYCDTSAGRSRPHVLGPLLLQVFQSVHDLSHPGTKATAKLVVQRFVWPGVQKYCRTWARAC
jgi:hypothetical protein